MAVGRAGRRAERVERVEAAFGKAAATAALDLFELVEYAWHDCYGELSPPDNVIDDIITCSQGDLVRMISYARLAVIDSRDLYVAARGIENARGGQMGDSDQSS